MRIYVINRLITQSKTKLLTVLSKDEINNLNLIKNEQAQVKYIQSRFIVRSILAKELDVKPQNVIIKLQNNKPINDQIYFNLSHSNNLIWLALSKSHDLGIDVECKTRNISPRILNAHFLHQEEKNFINNKNKADFFKFWTRKEAIGKLIGSGLTKEILSINTVDWKINAPQQNSSQHKFIYLNTKTVDNHIITLASFSDILNNDIPIKYYQYQNFI